MPLVCLLQVYGIISTIYCSTRYFSQIAVFHYGLHSWHSVSQVNIYVSGTWCFGFHLCVASHCRLEFEKSNIFIKAATKFLHICHMYAVLSIPPLAHCNK